VYILFQSFKLNPLNNIQQIIKKKYILTAKFYVKFICTCSGSGEGMKFVKFFKGGAMYKSLVTSALREEHRLRVFENRV
jgi:hypothetical protein